MLLSLTATEFRVSTVRYSFFYFLAFFQRLLVIAVPYNRLFDEGWLLNGPHTIHYWQTVVLSFMHPVGSRLSLRFILYEFYSKPLELVHINVSSVRTTSSVSR
jgi:hypothetical protein